MKKLPLKQTDAFSRSPAPFPEPNTAATGKIKKDTFITGETNNVHVFYEKGPLSDIAEPAEPGSSHLSSEIVHPQQQHQKQQQQAAQSLPTELLLGIFTYLDSRSLYRCSLCCRKWHDPAILLCWKSPKMPVLITPRSFRNFVRALFWSSLTCNNIMNCKDIINVNHRGKKTLWRYCDFIERVDDLDLFVGGEDNVLESELVELETLQQFSNVIPPNLQHSPLSANDTFSTFSLGTFPAYSLHHAIYFMMEHCINLRSLRLRLLGEYYLPWRHAIGRISELELCMRVDLPRIETIFPANCTDIQTDIKKCAAQHPRYAVLEREGLADCIDLRVDYPATNLKELRLQWAEIGDTCLERIAKYSTNLERVHITFAQRKRRIHRDDCFDEPGCISNEAAIMFLKLCPKLRILDLQPLHKVTMKFYDAVFENPDAKSLEHLTVTLSRKNGVVVNDMIDKLSTSLPRLVSITLVGEKSTAGDREVLKEKELFDLTASMTASNTSQFTSLTLINLDFLKECEGFCSYFSVEGMSGMVDEMFNRYRKCYPTIQVRVSISK